VFTKRRASVFFGVDPPSEGWHVFLALAGLILAGAALCIAVTTRSVVTGLLAASGVLLAALLLWQGLALT
jgi:hypothetical protein